jgi:hypothetical protein
MFDIKIDSNNYKPKYGYTRVIFFVLFLTATSYSQNRDIPVEVLGGNRAFTHQMYMTKYMHDKSRFGYFGYLRYESPYAKFEESSILGQSLFFYDVAGLISVGGGGYATNSGFVPQIAIAYSKAIRSFSFLAFAAVEPIKSPNGEFFTIMTYNPTISKNENWKLFMQFIGSLNFNLKGNDYNTASQYLRLGLENDGWQFGIGTDLIQISTTNDFSANTGLFIRRLL